MAFLTYTDGATTLTLDVSTSNATETEPDRIGDAARSFSGAWRSDEQEFRKWQFTHPLTVQADYVALRNMVKGGAQITVKGDAVESVGGFLAMVRITAAPFSEDVNGVAGFSRDVVVEIASAVAS